MLLKKVVLISILLVLIINLASAQYYYDSSYGFGFVGGFDDILVLYEQNSTWFDFFIFLLIFLGLTRAVFGQSHLRGQTKPISIGLSLALSFGLVMWERNTGINLLAFGPVAFLIILLLIMYVIFYLLTNLGTGKWVAAAWTYAIAYALLILFGQSVLGFINYFGFFPTLFQLMNFLFWVAVIGGIIGLFYSTPSPRPPAAGGP